MNKITCSFKDCRVFLETAEPVASVVRYTCRQHVGKNLGKELRFQETQFDPRVGDGTDPRAYERGGSVFPNRARKNTDEIRAGGVAPKKFVDRIIKKAGPELQNHENRAEITEILKEDIRDANSGIAKSEESGE